MSHPALMLTDDLIFFSRMAGTARAKGLAVRQVRTSEELLAAAAVKPPAGVILDLQNPGLDLTSVLNELRALCPVMPPVTAYGSHVEATALRAAREAGCDHVLPRSKFAALLESDLEAWMKAGND